MYYSTCYQTLKLNNENGRTLLHARTESHTITASYKKENGLDSIRPGQKIYPEINYTAVLTRMAVSL